MHMRKLGCCKNSLLSFRKQNGGGNCAREFFFQKPRAALVQINWKLPQLQSWNIWKRRIPQVFIMLSRYLFCPLSCTHLSLLHKPIQKNSKKKRCPSAQLRIVCLGLIDGNSHFIRFSCSNDTVFFFKKKFSEQKFRSCEAPNLSRKYSTLFQPEFPLPFTSWKIQHPH